MVIPCPRVLCRETIGPRAKISFSLDIAGGLYCRVDYVRIVSSLPRESSIDFSRTASIFFSFSVNYRAIRAIDQDSARVTRDAGDGIGLWTGSITTPRQIFQ